MSPPGSLDSSLPAPVYGPATRNTYQSQRLTSGE